MAKYRFGCGKVISVYVPRGWDYREIKRECGSTGHDGGINQCDECESKYPYSMPYEDESDMDWLERQGENY